MLALARALLGLIRPLRHGCVPFPRSTFASRGPHTRTAGVPPACAHDFVGPSRLVPNSTGGVGTGQTSGTCQCWRQHSLGAVSARRWLIHALAACPERTGRRPVGGRNARPRSNGPDSLPRRKGRCYSGPTPAPDILFRILPARWRTHFSAQRRRRRSIRRSSIDGSQTGVARRPR
jgi:hypothetical protein